MNIGELISIKTVEEEENVFGKGSKHTPYRAEIRLFSCVQQGDIDKLMLELKSLNSSIITGKMSEDNLMQYKYMAVSAVTLATRYAIQGGLNEKTAYDFSDRVIMLIDGMTSNFEILLCLATEIVKLTEMVKKSKIGHSPHIKKCICYIKENISEKITVSTLSGICGISSDYLSQIFKEEIGKNLSSYIKEQKLEKAKELIMQKKTNREVCDSLGFSSQSYFITAFKKQYNMTPSEFYNMTK